MRVGFEAPNSQPPQGFFIEGGNRVLLSQLKLLRNMIKADVRWLPAHISDNVNDGIGLGIAAELDENAWSNFRLLEAVMGGHKVVHEARKISGADKPVEISRSGHAGMILVEQFDHVANESRDVNLNEAYVLVGKTLDKV
jgi:hypothetical protein